MTQKAQFRTIVIPALATPAYRHFNDVLDFVWKAPEFINGQRTMEQRRAANNATSPVAKQRWTNEQRKLWRVFPGLLANANVFMVGSLLELHLQMLLDHFAPLVDQAKLRGVRDTIAALEVAGVPVSTVPHKPQIDAFIDIRNCLMHSAGVLTRSRRQAHVERIVETGAFLESHHLAKIARAERPVQIVDLPIGRRLVVDNEYPWLAAAYARDYIFEICGGQGSDANAAGGP
jgi:hypothetical protein